MTLQSGGAMALFVLRLAGLLSLEKSLGENSTDATSNFIGTTSNLNFTLPFDSNATDRRHQSNPDPRGNTPFVGSDNASDSSSEESEDDVGARSDDDYLLVPGVGVSDILTDVQTQTGSMNVSSEAGKPNYHYEGFTDSQLSTTSVDDGKNAKNLTGVQGKVRQLPETDDDSSHIGPGGKLDSTKADNLPPSPPPTLPPRNSNTGFSPVNTKPLNNTAMLFLANSGGTTSPVNPSRKVFLASANSSKVFSIEEGGDKYFERFHEMQIGHTDFVTSDFEYTDSVDLEPNRAFEHGNLSSMSLISPVPRPGHEEAFQEYTKSGLEKDNGKADSPNKAVANLTDLGGDNSSNTDSGQSIEESANAIGQNNTTSEFRNETSTKSVIGPNLPHETRYPTRTRIPIRNHPYPYGPKVLPEHVLKYSANLEPKQPYQIPGSLFPEQNFLFDNEGEKANITDSDDATTEGDQTSKGDSKEEGRYFVKTERPTILFHFDKPGYSPKLPDASLPPTRAPTPSDPWDCSPRCPRYSLLEWNQDYDIRQYPVTTWISTVIIAENRILAELEGYMRVQDYFYGLNDRGQLLNMTVPFVTQIKHGRHPGVLEESKDFTVSLYVNHIDDPLNYDLPTPISNEVLIDRLETKIVFVAGFEANVWEVTDSFLNEKATKLMERLRQNGEAFLDRYFYLASYSRPELYQPVYYELWIYATSFRDSVIITPPMAPRTRPPPSQLTLKSISKLCRGVECPPFEVLRTYRYGIQKRRYFDGLFVTTSPGECEFTTLSVWKGFMPLHLYKHGINSHMEVIEATRPIGLVHIKEDSTPTTECPQNMTMAIYLPKRLHSNPPLTGFNAPSVNINALQDVVVFVYTVGGYILEPGRVRKELSDLKHRLTEFGACFRDDEYYVVVYDFIIRYHGRQNEIWIVAENCKATLNG